MQCCLNYCCCVDWKLVLGPRERLSGIFILRSIQNFAQKLYLRFPLFTFAIFKNIHYSLTHKVCVYLILGWWFLHCHIEHHLKGGMAILLNVKPNEQPSTPADFPGCGNFDWSESDFFDKYQGQGQGSHYTLKLPLGSDVSSAI